MRTDSVHRELIRDLRARLVQHADPKSKRWWENYVKNSAPFLGVKMAAIRSLVHQWHTQHVADRLPPEKQVDLALAMFAEAHTEQKLAGTLFLGELLLPHNALDPDRDLPRFAALFDDERIYDWNTCDWFCVKVLGPLIEKFGPTCADPISDWRATHNLGVPARPSSPSSTCYPTTSTPPPSKHPASP
ncbi:MAG: hypothetical protein CMJ49_09540 [Planctomycetaceae bacterium]|nr:hypothetical protein [Planctomycetaceae bacterium]